MADPVSMKSFPRTVAICIATVATGCVSLHPEQCGEYMLFDAERRLCVCTENAIAVSGGCQPCATDEVVVGNACACPPRQAKNEANLCATVAGLGDSCSASMPCSDATYGFCAPSTAGVTSGTCTQQCATNDDCQPAYTCATWEGVPYCREFSGLGNACVEEADCAGLDARVCDTSATQACVVAGCSVAENDCPRGSTCCDLSAFGAGTLCMGDCP